MLHQQREIEIIFNASLNLVTIKYEEDDKSLLEYLKDLPATFTSVRSSDSDYAPVYDSVISGTQINMNNVVRMNKQITEARKQKGSCASIINIPVDSRNIQFYETRAVSGVMHDLHKICDSKWILTRGLTFVYEKKAEIPSGLLSFAKVVFSNHATLPVLSSIESGKKCLFIVDNERRKFSIRNDITSNPKGFVRTICIQNKLLYVHYHPHITFSGSIETSIAERSANSFRDLDWHLDTSKFFGEFVALKVIGAEPAGADDYDTFLLGAYSPVSDSHFTLAKIHRSGVNQDVHTATNAQLKTFDRIETADTTADFFHSTIVWNVKVHSYTKTPALHFQLVRYIKVHESDEDILEYEQICAFF